MNIRLNRRDKRRSVLPTVLLTLAFGAGFASVGQAQDIPETTVTAQSTSICGPDLAMRTELRSTAERAILATRINVAVDLQMRLSRQQKRSLKLAGKPPGTRG